MIKVINIGLKPEAQDWLDENVEKEHLSIDLIRVEYIKTAIGSEIEDQFSLYQYIEDVSKRKVFAIDQHAHMSNEVIVMHECLMFDEMAHGELLFAWTDREAQASYDRHIKEFGGSLD